MDPFRLPDRQPHAYSVRQSRGTSKRQRTTRTMEPRRCSTAPTSISHCCRTLAIGNTSSARSNATPELTPKAARKPRASRGCCPEMPLTAPEREERLIRIHAALNDTTARKRHKSEKRGYCRACDFVGALRMINPAFCHECVDSALRRPYRADFANAAAPRSTERYQHVRRRALPATAETSNSGTTCTWSSADVSETQRGRRPRDTTTTGAR